jgi:hypothetical protein
MAVAAHTHACAGNVLAGRCHEINFIKRFEGDVADDRLKPKRPGLPFDMLLRLQHERCLFSSREPRSQHHDE